MDYQRQGRQRAYRDVDLRVGKVGYYYAFVPVIKVFSASQVGPFDADVPYLCILKVPQEERIGF